MMTKGRDNLQAAARKRLETLAESKRNAAAKVGRYGAGNKRLK